MIDAPLQEEEAPILYYSTQIGHEAIPHYGACRRCRRAGILVAQVEIRYPGTIRRVECCRECQDAIMNVLDGALVEAGI